MGRGKRSFRGAELMGKRRAAKYQRSAEPEGSAKTEQPNVQYEELIYENAAFEEYYKAQGICPAEEWDDFMATQRLRLPAAVRVNVSAPLWRSTLALLTRMSQKGVRSLHMIYTPSQLRGLMGKNSVKQLIFFPHQLAWQWDAASKVDMKKNEDFKEIREQIINEDYRGVLTRQEAVSMLPCLFLGIQPDHLVLDMCSSPGSKTSEMLDMLQWKARVSHLNENSVGIQPVDGAVIANDVDLKRAVTLTHQVQKLSSPSIAVSCLDAACFPTLHEETGDGSHKEKIQFDRILADVPCSGDGTLRKNVDVWRSWNTGGGHSMHPIQLSILYRGLELLRVGGKIVYSTCSMNPLEDEAVIATILSQQAGRIEIVEPPELPGLKWTKGKSSWLVPSPPTKRPSSTEDGPVQPNAEEGTGITFYRTFDEVPEEFRHRIRPTMFPPQGTEAMHLEKCVRVLPHHNNTGGFFVCCLRKLAELDSSRIFVSNKSRDKAAAGEKQQPRPKAQQRAELRSSRSTTSEVDANGEFDASCGSKVAAEKGTTSNMASAVKQERNPLLDGALLPEEFNEGPADCGDVESLSEIATTRASVGDEDSLYSLAAAASKPGGLFHLLLPANCDSEGSEQVQLIFDFFGLSDKTPLLADDLRAPSCPPSLCPDLLFRRVHSRKKIFLLSKKLADLVNACFRIENARRAYQGPQLKGPLQSECRASGLRRQLQGLLNSKIKWMHAGATVLIRHSESDTDQEFGARGWRVAQEGAALMACFMRRRILFVSLVVARLLLVSEERVVRSSDLKSLEDRKQLRNLSSCRAQDGSIEAGGLVCVICPTSIVPTDDSTETDARQTASESEGLDEQSRLAGRYPIVDNPAFKSLSDSFCVACMITKGGNMHAYMSGKEAKALASHLFSMPSE